MSRIGPCCHGPQCGGTGPDCDLDPAFEQIVAERDEARTALAEATELLGRARRFVDERIWRRWAEDADAFLARTPSEER